MTRKTIKQGTDGTGISYAYIHGHEDTPVHIQFANGNETRYVYSASGQKLRVVYYVASPNLTRTFGVKPDEPSPGQVLFAGQTEYLLGGNLIMKDGMIDRLLFEGGYAKATPVSSTTYGFTPFFYNQDHLGNNREVVSVSGAVQQVTNYYPFGAPYADPSAVWAANLQPYRYNGKELDKMHGLNTYDYGARQYNPVTARWDRMDPLCEKYYSMSPYAYCANNPVKNIDLDGRRFDDIYYNENGNELYRVKKDGPDNYFVIKTTKNTNELYEDASPKQKGWSNPISNEEAFTTEVRIMNGDITGKHIKNVTYLFNSSQINGIMNSIKDDGKGGTSPKNNREYSGNLKSDGVKDTKQSTVGDPSKEQYLISYGNSDYHSHASGTKPTKKIGYSRAWQQGPSAQDIRTAKGNELVFGMRNGIIYKYNKNGVFATIPISIFK